jgi:glycine/D-amino acid oxidase-like deaminating enzyme
MSGGSLHPLKYCRGLAQAAQRLGVATVAPVARLERRTSGWRLHSAQGPHIDAERVVMATNGYTDDLWPHLRQSVIAANSFIVATRPLPPALGASILPGGEVTSDSPLAAVLPARCAGPPAHGGTRPLPRSARASRFRPPGTLGGPAVLNWPEWSSTTAGRGGWPSRATSCRTCMNAAGLSIALGYNGRGIAMASTMGRCLAQRLTGQAGVFLSRSAPSSLFRCMACSVSTSPPA